MLYKVFVVLVSCAALASAAMNVRQAQAGGNILSVTGVGNVDVPTTQTQVSASIENTANCDPNEKCTGQAAQQAVAKALQNVLDYLKGVDSVSQLTTTSVQLMPQYNYSASPQQLTGYQASSSISFQVDNEQAGEVLNDMVAKGVTTIGSVSFVASDSAIDKATSQALKKAVANAQSQADTVLEAIGATSQGIVGVQVGPAQPPTPVPVPMYAASNAVPAMADSASPPTTPIEGGTQTVSASVTLNIKYEQ